MAANGRELGNAILPQKKKGTQRAGENILAFPASAFLPILSRVSHPHSGLRRGGAPFLFRAVAWPGAAPAYPIRLNYKEVARKPVDPLEIVVDLFCLIYL
jgi:hypothetical protein